MLPSLRDHGWPRTRAVIITQRQDPRPLIGVDGGASRDRTDDLLLAKQALSQLSYGPA